MRPQEPVTRAFFATKSSLTQDSESPAASRLAQVLVLVIVTAAGTLCLANWLATFFAVHGLYLALPFEDYWRVVIHLAEIQRLDLRFLWQQHNEHRIVFPELAFVADAFFFHLRRIFPIVLSCALYLASWALLVWPLMRDAKLTRVHRLLIAFTAGAVIGWRGSALSLADPFLLQWTLLSFAALCALVLLPEAASRLKFALLVACAVIATYSCGCGMLLWPVLWIAARALKFPRRRFFALLVAGSISIALYFVGYRFSQSGNLANLFQHPVYSAGFVAMFFSMPFGGMKSAHFGIYIGAIALAAFVLLFVNALRARRVVTPAAIVLFGWCLFVLLSAVLIASGRIVPADTTFTAAKAPRYLAPVMLSWGALCAVLLWTASVNRWRIARPAVCSLVLALLLLLAQRKLSWWWTISLRPYIAAQIAELSLENGIFDPELVRAVFPSPELVAHYLPELQRAQLSIYAHPSPLGTKARRANPPLEITRTLAMHYGLELAGRSVAPVRRVFIIDNQRTVIGLGRSLAFGLPTEIAPAHTPPAHALASQTWIAFLPQRYAGAPFSVIPDASR